MLSPKKRLMLLAGFLVFALSAACETEPTQPGEQAQPEGEQAQPEGEQAQPVEQEQPDEDAQAAGEPVVRTATLSEINPDLTDGEVAGTARLSIDGQRLSIVVEATGLPPNMTVLQHFHGFEDGTREARCPDQAQDANDDGVVDLMETREVAGVTMVPFIENPASMDIVGGNYPTSDDQGNLSYSQTVDLTELQDAFEEKFGSRELMLENRVVFLHGVPEGTELPDSVQSLEDVPAHVTVPIACGEL